MAHDKQFGVRVFRWIQRQMPTREQLERNRFLRPVAHRVLAPELWRFTRRSVPRGVALGLFVGIFLLIPGLQIVGAAFAAIFTRVIGHNFAWTITPEPWPLAYVLGLTSNKLVPVILTKVLGWADKYTPGGK